MWLLRHVLVLLCSSSVGLLSTALILPGMHLTALGFVVTIVVFAVVQSALLLIAHVLRRLLGLLAYLGMVVATLLALLIAAAVGGGLQLDGWKTWIGASLLIWILSAIATGVLTRLEDSRHRRRHKNTN